MTESVNKKLLLFRGILLSDFWSLLDFEVQRVDFLDVFVHKLVDIGPLDLVLRPDFNFEPVGRLYDDFLLVLGRESFHLLFSMLLDDEEFIEGIFRWDVLFLYSEYHPNPSSRYLHWWDYHHDYVWFHWYPSDHIRGYIEHPHKSEDQIEEYNSIVNFLVSVYQLWS